MKCSIIFSLLISAQCKPFMKESPVFDVVCPDSEDGNAVFVPHPTDCGLYYECVGNSPVLMSCPGDLFFDPSLNVCNWPEFVDCEPQTEEPETTTTGEEETTTAREVEITTAGEVETTTAGEVETTTAEEIETTTAGEVETSTAEEVETTAAEEVETTTAGEVDDTTAEDVETTVF